jgi:hypothetical protein
MESFSIRNKDDPERVPERGSVFVADQTIVPTYQCKKIICKERDDNVKPDKKLRVKLICVFPKKKYLIAQTTVAEYYSLFGGVVNQVNTKNYFLSILETLEKEFWDETSHTVSIRFKDRKMIYKKPKYYYDPSGESELEELPFVYVGTFHEHDTIFNVIYIPKFSNDLIELWNRQIYFAQESLLKRIFEGWNIQIEKIFEVNRVYHQKLMRIKSQYSYMPKTIYNFICSKLINYYHMLEKAGVNVIDEDEFFDPRIVWEWNTMDVMNIKQKLKDLYIKTGVQI